MKQALSLLLTLALLLCFVPVASAADYSGATAFVFSDDGIAVTEGGATDYKISGTALTINAAGTYVLSGACADGSVKVKKGTTGVTLVLNGLELTSAATAPITCNKSTGVTLVIADGSVNTLTDSEQNNDDNYPDNTDAENAVIKCKNGSQVTICGGGTLNINANGKNGVKSGATTDGEGEAWLLIREATLNIQAPVNDAINAEQLLTVESGTLNIAAADDGVHCDYVLNIGTADGDGPTITITDCGEGLEGATLNVYSGNITIHSEDDCLNAANSDLTDYAYEMNIYGGTLAVDAETGDGLDSNGTLTITGGTVLVWTASTADNQPLDADGTITISGGLVLGAGGSSGAGGMNISAAQPYVIFGSNGMGGQPGGENPPVQPGEGNGQPGGGTTPPSKPDDGSSQPGGGTTLPSKPDDGNGQPGDGTTPPSKPDDGNGQPGGQSAVLVAKGETLSIRDSEGNTVYSAAAVCDVHDAVFSSAGLISGETYTLCSGDTEAATATAGTESSAPGFQPGGDPGKPGDRPDIALPYTDVSQSDWFYPYVAFAYERAWMTGTSETTFSPEETTTRAMLVTVLYRLEGKPAVDAASGFSDVSSGNYYADAVAWAKANGIINGTSETTFSPNEPVTREQTAAILYRYAQYKGYDVEKTADLTAYADAAAIHSYAKNAMSWAAAAGILNGVSSTSLEPTGSATRAQVATVLTRFAQTAQTPPAPPQQGAPDTNAA